MARRKDKEKAIRMRLKGASYSQIRASLSVGKGTLSEWLRGYPLSENRIRELRGRNPKRIESFRNTMARKREVKLKKAYEEAKLSIRKLSKRDLFIAGLFLYWGEGDKNGNTFSVSNTDPNMMRLFMKWSRALGIREDKFRVVLHIYSDMDEDKERNFWSDVLKIPIKNFRKTYVKDSTLTGLTYKNGFKHGTCMVRVYDKKLVSFILMGIKYIGDIA